MSAEGYKLATVSNAGLPPGKASLTYLRRSVLADVPTVRNPS